MKKNIKIHFFQSMILKHILKHNRDQNKMQKVKSKHQQWKLPSHRCPKYKDTVTKELALFLQPSSSDLGRDS